MRIQNPTNGKTKLGKAQKVCISATLNDAMSLRRVLEAVFSKDPAGADFRNALHALVHDADWTVVNTRVRDSLDIAIEAVRPPR
jgi:hypothetical protein